MLANVFAYHWVCRNSWQPSWPTPVMTVKSTRNVKLIWLRDVEMVYRPMTCTNVNIQVVCRNVNCQLFYPGDRAVHSLSVVLDSVHLKHSACQTENIWTARNHMGWMSILKYKANRGDVYILTCSSSRLKKKTHSSSKKIMELTFHWWRNLLMHTNMLPSPYVSVFLCTPHFHYMVTRLRPCIGTMMKLYEWIVRGWFMFVCALMLRSVIGYHHFHWMNMNTTHLLFSHTHSSSEHFFSTHMNSGGAL